MGLILAISPLLAFAGPALSALVPRRSEPVAGSRAVTAFAVGTSRRPVPGSKARQLLLMACLAGATTLHAEPVKVDAPPASAVWPLRLDVAAEAPPWEPGPAEAAVTDTDAETWYARQSGWVIQDQLIERERQVVLQQDFIGRPATWIQTASLVNLADFPSFANPAAQSERDLRTLEWLLEQRRRQAASAAANRASATERTVGELEADPPWWRNMLPQAWLPTVKANRDVAVGAGITVLLLVWLASALAQRPSASSTTMLAAAGSDAGRSASDSSDAEDATTRRRRRRRHRSNGGSGSGGDGSSGSRHRHGSSRSRSSSGSGSSWSGAVARPGSGHRR
jgi:hypothetical protein